MTGRFGHTRTVKKPLVVTAGAYSANEVVGGLLEFEVGTGGGGGIVQRVTLTDSDNEKTAMKLYLFDELPTTIADNATFAPTIGDLKNLVDIITIAAADYVTLNGEAVAIKRDLNVSYAIGGYKLYAYLVCDATPTYTATTDLQLAVTAWLD